MTLRHHQRRYREVYAHFEALEAARDRVLAPIDTGEREWLTAEERGELEQIDQQQRLVYDELLTLERSLLAAARNFLIRYPATADGNPDLTILQTKPIPAGMRDRAVMMALELGHQARVRYGGKHNSIGHSITGAE